MQYNLTCNKILGFKQSIDLIVEGHHDNMTIYNMTNGLIFAHNLTQFSGLLRLFGKSVFAKFPENLLIIDGSQKNMGHRLFAPEYSRH